MLKLQFSIVSIGLMATNLASADWQASTNNMQIYPDSTANSFSWNNGRANGQDWHSIAMMPQTPQSISDFQAIYQKMEAQYRAIIAAQDMPPAPPAPSTEAVAAIIAEKANEVP